MARTPRRRAGAAAAPSPGGEGSARRVRENLPRPAAAPVRSAATPSAEKAAPARRRRSPFSFFGRLTPRFIGDVISELRKVTWPTFSETRYLTLVVAVVAIAVGFLLGGVDIFFGWIIEKIFF